MAELFTLDEAAAIAEIEPDTVRTALEKRAVTPSRKVKTGKAVRYRFSEGDFSLSRNSPSLSRRTTKTPSPRSWRTEARPRNIGRPMGRTSSFARET